MTRGAFAAVLAQAETSSESSEFVVAPSVGLIVSTILALAVWIAIAVAIARFGRARGQSFGLLLATSLVLSPLIALLLIAVLPPRAGLR